MPPERSGGGWAGSERHYLPKQERFSGARPGVLSGLAPQPPAGVWEEDRGAKGAGLQLGERRPILPLPVAPRLFPHGAQLAQSCHRWVPRIWGLNLQLRADTPSLPEGCGRGLHLVDARRGQSFPAPGLKLCGGGSLSMRPDSLEEAGGIY